jgi:hypothetical protein
MLPGRMSWTSALVAFVVCHAAGDFLLQTDWQARHKARGLGRDPVARRALLAHVATYLLAFVPPLAIAGGPGALAAAAVIYATHVVIDDGRLVAAWIRRVKHVDAHPPPAVVSFGVDQSLHLVTLAGAAALL